MKNVNFVWNTISSTGGLHFYKSDKTTKLCSINTSVTGTESAITSGLSCEYDENNNLVKFVVNGYSTITDEVCYVRVNASNIDDTSIITVNEEIV